MKSFAKYLLLLGLSVPFIPVQAQDLTEEDKAWLALVDPILTYQERREFRKRYTTPAQRKAYIELFWARRDPDLSDQVNTFRDDYMARYDYVMANFERKSAKKPESQRGKMYMLLGKPDRIEYRTDPALFNRRLWGNSTGNQPELWTYNKFGFGYPRHRLRVQFIPISTFNEFATFLEPVTEAFLNELPYRYIVNPDLHLVPADAVEENNFQAEIGGEEDEIPSKPPYNEERAEELETRPVAVPTAPVAPAAPVEEPKPEISETAVAVPTTTTNEETVNEVRWDQNIGNAKNLVGRFSYLTREQDRNLLLGRLGFPLESLDYNFNGDQYEAPFILEYSLTDSQGRTVAGDRIQSQVLIPNKKVLEKENAFFSKELAMLVPADRYQLKIQLSDPTGKKMSFYEQTLEIPPRRKDVMEMSRPALLDPNINPAQANFRIDGDPYSLHMTKTYKTGERLYPILELSSMPSQEELDSMNIRIINTDGGKAVREWLLFPEETSATPQKTLIVHPILDTRDILPGTYRLQFEMETGDGGLLVGETEFTIGK